MTRSSCHLKFNPSTPRSEPLLSLGAKNIVSQQAHGMTNGGWHAPQAADVPKGLPGRNWARSEGRQGEER